MPEKPVKMRCHGHCKRLKLAMLFNPSDRRSAWPICRECRKLYRKKSAVRAGDAWRFSARRLFVNAIVAGRAS